MTTTQERVAEPEAEPRRPAGPNPPAGVDAAPARPRPPAGTATGPDRPIYATSTTLLVLAVILLGFVVHLVMLSRLEHRAAQQSGYNELRIELAQGTAPVTQTDASGKKLLAMGAPVAQLKIPRIGVNEVVFNGTTPSTLMKGPGHERDTVLPGQAGTATIMGRAGAYGGPFGKLQDLDVGDRLTVTTGQGTSTYRVIDSRRAGDAVPPPPGPGKGRLTLVTADGTPFLPLGTLRVDADLISTTQPTPAMVLPAGSLPPPEMPMGTDTSRIWALVFWLQALVLVVIAAVWAWYRWGRRQAWIVFLPMTAVAGIGVADQAALLLPNLL